MNEVKNPKVRKPLIYYYMMALLIMLLLNTFLFPALLGRKEVEVDYSTFTTQLAQGNIQQVEVLDQKIEYLLNDEEDNNIYITGNMGDPKLVDKLDAAKVIYGKEIEEPMSPFLYLLISVGGPILLFALLLWRGVTLAAHAPDRFGALLVVGFVVQVALQAVLNIAVVTNTIPNTGISLPFFSSGGTSLMMLLGEMGIVLSVSRGET